MTIVDQEKCCGCRACLQICPQKAISTYFDKFGFERISIDDILCIKCNKCKSVCPILNVKKTSEKITCGSAYCKNINIKRSGSSGGLFGLMAMKIIENGGVVYGAAFDSKLHLYTTRAENLTQLEPLLKSKYLLCDTSGSFKKIQSDLENGKQVLYCSSPCQIAALKNYFKTEYANLLCIEFVCHGVGSQKQFYDSITYIEKKSNIKILKFSFREKFKKASSHYYYYYYRDLLTGKEKGRRDIYMTFPYYYAYQERLTCRESCYECLYATENRVADITIGDFHEINRYEPNIDRFAGVSMFVCNSKTGQCFFDTLRTNLIVKEYDWGIIKSNNRFSGKEIMSSRREDYLTMIATESCDKAYSSFLNYKKDWRYYYYHLPKVIRNIGNRLLRRE